MWEIFRKIGFALAVLIVSASLYFIFYAEKEVQHDVLEFSLNLMGDKLLAMVPDGVEKDRLRELYEGFKQRATEGLIEPEQVETVAANILNISNTDKSITPQQAEGILQSALMIPKVNISTPTPVEPTQKTAPKPPKAPKLERWEIAGKRVKVMFEFNEHVHEAMKEHSEKCCEASKQIHYQAKDGLNLIVDARLKTHMDEKEFMILAKEFEHLEQEELLAWQENLSEELARESEAMRDELEVLHESLEALRAQHLTEALEQIESLKSLEHLEHIPFIDADSIHKVVEMSLREAGIHTQHKKSK